jgi:hypothetical protein
MAQNISGPVAEWLVAWPATGGSAYQRLQQALARLPQAVQQLHDRVQARAAVCDKGTG